MISKPFLIALCALAAVGCSKSKSSTTPAVAVATTTADEVDDDEQTTATTAADDGLGFAITGSLLRPTALTATPNVTHVMALNTESAFAYAVAVDATTGFFKLDLKSEGAEFLNANGTINRAKVLAANPDDAEELNAMTDAELIDGVVGDTTETSPWIVAYVDSTKIGAEMLISRFAASSLDTVAPSMAAQARLKLGTVTPVSGAAATVDASYADVLTATGMSSGTADVFGAIDDVSLRYINPDIDNDGKLDMPIRAADGIETGTRKRYTLDFHNRFNLVDPNNAAIDHRELKNKFPEDLVGSLANVGVVFTGSGITPELEKTVFSNTAPSTYKWKFSTAVDLNTTCTEDPAATTLAANTWCTQSFTDDPNYARYQLDMQVDQPVAGTYTLQASEKTFTWTNVAVSDFSAGVGFLAIMVKYVVDENGTAATTDDVMTGIQYKFMQKTATGWVAASAETLKLIIKGEGGTISMHLENWDMEVGVSIPKTPTGTIVFADAEMQYSSTVSQATKDDVEAGNGFLFNRFSGSGVSYDDKLGMRFFF